MLLFRDEPSRFRTGALSAPNARPTDGIGHDPWSLVAFSSPSGRRHPGGDPLNACPPPTNPPATTTTTAAPTTPARATTTTCCPDHHGQGPDHHRQGHDHHGQGHDHHRQAHDHHGSTDHGAATGDRRAVRGHVRHGRRLQPLQREVFFGLGNVRSSIPQWQGDHNMGCGPHHTAHGALDGAHDSELFWWCAPRATPPRVT